MKHHMFNGSVLVLMTRGQTGFESYSVCYALRHYMQAKPCAVIVKLMPKKHEF